MLLQSETVNILSISIVTGELLTCTKATIPSLPSLLSLNTIVLEYGERACVPDDNRGIDVTKHM